MLVTVNHNGKKVDAVAQVTKIGYVYLLDRVTGKPLFGKQVPPSDIPGEKLAATQVFPAKPPALVPQAFTDLKPVPAFQ